MSVVILPIFNFSRLLPIPLNLIGQWVVRKIHVNDLKLRYLTVGWIQILQQSKLILPRDHAYSN